MGNTFLTGTSLEDETNRSRPVLEWSVWCTNKRLKESPGCYWEKRDQAQCLELDNKTNITKHIAINKTRLNNKKLKIPSSFSFLLGVEDS